MLKKWPWLVLLGATILGAVIGTVKGFDTRENGALIAGVIAGGGAGVMVIGIIAGLRGKELAHQLS